ncbi:MAG: alternative ribosome rescue aminoacyl-tRNA hydrolase ArfB [Spirochaetia bacterium]|jgi:ribosome-associated protein
MTPGEVAAVVRAHGSFSFARSGGPGGQNVNKVSSKVVARLRLDALQFLGSTRRSLVESRLANRITMDGEIVLTVQDTRDQARNREIAIERLAGLIARALVVQKGRVRTRPSRAAREARLRSKKVRSAHKRLRGCPDQD